MRFTWWKRAAHRPTRTCLSLNRLEARDVPASITAVGAGPGGPPVVNVYNTRTGALIFSFDAYDPNFRGGVNVAVGDINGDGVPDVITGAGAGGGPHVKVFDGRSLLNHTIEVVRSFFAYAPAFTGGVSVAAGDVNGDGHVDIITGAGPGGGPHVRVFDGTKNITGLYDSTQLVSFYAYDPNFHGGVNVAAGDFGGDQKTAEIVTGAGPGGGPHVKVFSFPRTSIPGDPNPASLQPRQIASFFAYDPNFHGGVSVAVGYITNNRDGDNVPYADIITGAGPGGGPHVKVFRLLDANTTNSGPEDFTVSQAASFFAFPANFTGGVNVGVVTSGDAEGTTTGEFAAEVASGGPPVINIYAGKALNDLQTFQPTLVTSITAFAPNFTGGVNGVGGTDIIKPGDLGSPIAT